MAPLCLPGNVLVAGGVLRRPQSVCACGSTSLVVRLPCGLLSLAELITVLHLVNATVFGQLAACVIVGGGWMWLLVWCVHEVGTWFTLWCDISPFETPPGVEIG